MNIVLASRGAVSRSAHSRPPRLETLQPCDVPCNCTGNGKHCRGAATRGVVSPLPTVPLATKSLGGEEVRGRLDNLTGGSTYSSPGGQRTSEAALTTRLERRLAGASSSSRRGLLAETVSWSRVCEPVAIRWLGATPSVHRSSRQRQGRL
jgi:hypothetical protein